MNSTLDPLLDDQIYSSSIATLRPIPIQNTASTKIAFSSGPYSPTRRIPSPPSRKIAASPPFRKIPTRSAIIPIPTVQISPEEIKEFETLCFQSYYEGDQNATNSIDSIISKSSDNQKILTKLRRDCRAGFHLSQEILRRKEVQDLLQMKPGDLVMKSLKITEGGLESMRSAEAIRIRKDGLKHLLATDPLPEPFWNGLFALFKLQTLAGAQRIEWLVDVAVFSESGGSSEWSKGSIELLKGILGFSETIQLASQRNSEVYSFEELETLAINTTPNPTTMEKLQKTAPTVPPHRVGVNSQPIISRDRSFSDPRNTDHDPFLDPELSKSSRRFSVTLTDHPLEEDFSPSISPDSSLPSTPSKVPLLSSEQSNPLPLIQFNPNVQKTLTPPSPQFRIFIMNSYMTNIELRDLMKCFPKHIRAKAKSIELRTSSPKVMESGMMRLKSYGHGVLSLGDQTRERGWKGTRWQRFVSFWRNLFSKA